MGNGRNGVKRERWWGMGECLEDKENRKEKNDTKGDEQRKKWRVNMCTKKKMKLMKKKKTKKKLNGENDNNDNSDKKNG